ncbi:MAG: ParB/RepB/Spo0J family partition protein [Oscillospiraceae bacterium]|nr:ParB/RepB/Spo0J family partition protein [Oscillospiraceae bacterium]
MAFANIGKDRVRSIPLAQIMVNPAQPRTRFEEGALQQLAQSIDANGLLQPVTVREAGPGKYQLIAGERRCRACLLLGHTHVPAIVKSCTMQESAVLALIENIQRQDLDVFDQAEGISRLIGYWGVTQEEAAVKLGLAQSTLANKLRLLRLPPSVQERMRQGGLAERHGRALLKLPDEAAQLAAVKTICQKNMTVSQAEQYIETLLARQKMKKPTRLFICKDIRLFMNTIDKAVKTMTDAGLAVQSAREDQGAFIELTIRIPKEPHQTAKPA